MDQFNNGQIVTNQDVVVIDSYNKFQMLLILFDALLRKLKTQGDSDIVDYYDRNITQFIIQRKIAGHSREDSDFSLLFVNNKELACSIIPNTVEEVQLKLLSVFEEEVRNFLKNKNELMVRLKTLNELNKDNTNIDVKNLRLSQLLSDIYSILIENFEIMNEILENFKIKEIQREKNDITKLENEFVTITSLMNSTVDKITQKLSGDQSFTVLNMIKSRLNEDNNELEMEIKLLKRKLNEYSDQGEELSDLVKEYKKICNLIECAKIEINK